MVLRTANTESGKSFIPPPMIPIEETTPDDEYLSGLIEEHVEQEKNRAQLKAQIGKEQKIDSFLKSLGDSLPASSGSIDAKLSSGPTKLQRYFLGNEKTSLNYHDDFGYNPVKEGERLSVAFKRNYAGRDKTRRVYHPDMSEKDFAGLMNHISSQNPRNYTVEVTPQYDGEIKADDRWVMAIKVKNPEGDQLNRDRLTVLREVDGRRQKAVLTKNDLKTIRVNGVEINDVYIMVGRGDPNNHLFAGQIENAYFRVIKPIGKHQNLYQKITFGEQKSPESVPQKPQKYLI